MAMMILVTGGSASGKSRWATTKFAAYDNVLYLCAAGQLAEDTRRRIEYDNKRNYVEWDINTSVVANPDSYYKGHKFAIFDNLATYTLNTFQEMCPDVEKFNEEMSRQIQKKVVDEVLDLYEAVKLSEGTLIVETLETGFSITPDNKEQAAFRRVLGLINQRIANCATEVYLSVSGIQFKIKS